MTPRPFFPSSSHTDAGAGDSPRHRVLCAQRVLWRPELVTRSPRYREHTAGEETMEVQTESVSLNHNPDFFLTLSIQKSHSQIETNLQVGESDFCRGNESKV